MEVKDQEYFQLPQKMQAPLHKKDQRKYCRFHRDHKHDTDECILLKDEIEALIRCGCLVRFVANQPGQTKPAGEMNTTEDSNNNQPTTKVITTICGGSPSVGSSESRPEQLLVKSLQYKRAQT